MVESVISENNVVQLNGVPLNCNFDFLKTSMEQKLDECDAVIKIKYSKKDDKSYNKVFVHLKSCKNVENLLNAKFVEVECNDQLHKVVITKPRSFNDIAKHGHSSLLTHEFLQHEPQKQYSIFCTKIPYGMRNRQYLRNHFERFGSVKKLFLDERKKFAFIDFFNKDSAQAALDSKGQLKHSEKTLKLEWNRGKNNKRIDKQHEYTVRTAVNWNKILLKKKDIFDDGLLSSLLVQNVPENITRQELCSYFEMKFANAKVRDVFYLPDGILMLFENLPKESDILFSQQWILRTNELRLFHKPVPSIYQDRFLIKENVDEVSVKHLLECCHIDDDYKLECHIKNFLYLAIFPFNVDLEKYQTALKELNLKNIHFQLYHLCHTDCIMVRGISREVSNNLIKSIFTNKSKSGGGTVTKIIQGHNESYILVYFADYQDAEIVVEKSKSCPIYVGRDKIRVSLWHNHAFSFNQKGSTVKKFKTVKESCDHLRCFQHTLSCDSDIVEYLQRHPRALESFENQFSDLALIDLSSRKQLDFPVICFSPVKKKSFGKKVDQDSFEFDCLQVLHDALVNYSTEVIAVNKEKVASLQKSYLWSENCNVIQIQVKEDLLVSCFVRWNHEGGSAVKFAGVSDEVTAAVQWLNEIVNIVEKSLGLSAEKLRAMQELGILSELKKSFVDKVQIDLKKNSSDLVFRGDYDLVKFAILEAQKRLKSVLSFDFESLDFYKKEFFQQILKEDNEKSTKFFQHIKSLLDQTKSRAIFIFDPKLEILYEKGPNDPSQILTEVVRKDHVTVDGGLRGMSETGQWKRLEQQVEAGGTRMFKDFAKSLVTLVGLKDSVNQSTQLVRQHILKNAMEERVVALPYLVAVFIETFPKRSNANSKLDLLKWKLSPHDGGIVLEGSCKAVNDASSWLTSLNVVTAHHDVSEPGMCGYFRSDKGREFLESVQELSTCNIWLGSMPSWGDQIAGKKPQPPLKQSEATLGGTVLATIKIPDNNVELSVIQADVTKLDCDAMVSFWNKSLDVDSNTILVQLIGRGGRFIIDDVAETLRTMPRAPAVSTAPGDLPCKKVIHVSEPSWDGRLVPSIKHTIMSILCECDRFALETVSIPILDCDEAVVRSYASTLVREISAYLRARPSFVNKVCFVAKEESRILNEFKMRLVELGSPEQRHDDEPVMMSQTTQRDDIAPSNAGSDPVPSALEVSIVKGDIALHKADVIVTSTLPKNFPSCSGSATAKALLARSGALLLKVCLLASRKHSLQAGQVVRTPGCGLDCAEIFHVLIDRHSDTNEATLEHVVSECLQMADNAGYSRIAFPAIGAGGMRYPADFLAQMFKRKSEEFQATHLKHLDVILHPNDSSTIWVFESVLTAPSNISSEPNRTSSPDVKLGNVLETSCDALLIPTSSDYSWEDGCQLWKRTVEAAGRKVLLDLMNSPIYRSIDDSFRVTTGGRLRCNLIVFTRVCRSKTELAANIASVLRWLDEQGVTSLAAPSLATANCPLKTDDVADALAAQISSFLTSSPASLSHIELVLLEAAQLKTFKLAFNCRSTTNTLKHSPSPTPRPSVQHSPSPKICPSVIPLLPSLPVMTLHISSIDEERVDEARHRIEQQVKEKSSERRINNEVLARLSPDDEEEIMNLAQKHDVVLRKKFTSGTNFSLLVAGLKDDVFNACDVMNGYIQELREALTQSEFVVWKLKDPNTSQMLDFCVRTSFEIEAAYKKSPQGSVDMEIKLAGRKRDVLLDFKSMTLLDTHTGGSSSLERSLKANAGDLPPHWESMGGSQWKKVFIPPTSKEYGEVIEIFQSSGFPHRVIQLERIQNPTLYKQFLAQKHKVEKRMEDPSAEVTRKLFHGTNADVCDNIYKDGFDRSHCGKNATSFGRGVYFATSAVYSDRFTHADSAGRRRMFLAEVITGEFCQGDSSLRVPPLKPGSSSDHYDSVVNRVGSPTMFVVFKDASVYPSYVLTY